MNESPCISPSVFIGGSRHKPVCLSSAVLAQPVRRVAPRALVAKKQMRLHAAAAQDLVMQRFIRHAEKMIDFLRRETTLAHGATDAGRIMETSCGHTKPPYVVGNYHFARGNEEYAPRLVRGARLKRGRVPRTLPPDEAYDIFVVLSRGHTTKMSSFSPNPALLLNMVLRTLSRPTTTAGDPPYG
jgi:hypothetical protein